MVLANFNKLTLACSYTNLVHINGQNFHTQGLCDDITCKHFAKNKDAMGLITCSTSTVQMMMNQSNQSLDGNASFANEYCK